MESYQLPELPIWLEDCPHTATLFEKFRAKYFGEVPFFYGRLFGVDHYGIVYLIWSREKKRFYVDFERGYSMSSPENYPKD